MTFLFTVFLTCFVGSNAFGGPSIQNVNVTQTAGLSAILPCRVSGIQGGAMVIWKNPEGMMISRNKEVFLDRQRMVVSNLFLHEWSLDIKNLKESDAGVYECILTTNPEEITRIRLTVLVAPRIIESQSSPARIDVSEFSDVTITCRVAGTPQPVVTWYKNKDQNQHESTGEKGEQFTLYNVTRENSGYFSCVADNGVSSPAKRTFYINVQYKPVIRVTNKAISQSMGRIVKLECRIIANPRTTLQDLIWRHHYDIQKSWKHKIELFVENEHTVVFGLEINSLQEDDYGTYIVYASNSQGVATDTILLQEHIPTTTTTTTTTPTTTTVKETTTTEPTTTSGFNGSSDQTNEDSSDQPQVTSTMSPSYNVSNGMTNESSGGMDDHEHDDGDVVIDNQGGSRDNRSYTVIPPRTPHVGEQEVGESGSQAVRIDLILGLSPLLLWLI